MPFLTNLPTELRQQILLLALPETNRVESAVPTQFVHLFHINQRLRHDMSAVASIWTPIHYISHPSTLTSCTPRTRDWNCSRICLDLFYSSFLGRIVNRYSNQSPASYAHPGLVLDWINAVPFLPRDVNEIWLDVTPAPAEKRVHHPRWHECGPPWFDLFVHGDHAAQRFLGGHVQDVAVLIRALEKRYGGRVSIKLSGRLSVKSVFFVQAIRKEVGREKEFVGSWVSNEDALGASVSSELCPMARETGRCGMHMLAWLVKVVWSKDTGDLYTELANECSEWMLIRDVKKIAEVHEGEVRVVLPLGDGLRRAFQCQVATDLGLKTIESGEGGDRHVIVQR
ncbi:uncharacterized protein M421DRAFT_415491 [Didymella exigua CBS 183.55]|uniref:R3H domain-containing protein n=1 Tax=Didymella exigua CBS 183.55 TaxID=1150837 RepID=A0A6A5S6K1_9PLEO|nr:uncharacterized protein M421DRAFT_415491 [Didymella exigua CBS 183.55]KAF1933127.1 hypothetical protein M421DRAFT_415491 [Didymella exigua CBS 183.55]